MIAGRVARRMPPEAYLLLALAAVLLGATALAQPYLPDRKEGPVQPALSIHSNRPDGARALSLWLADLGYDTIAIEHRPFDVGPDVDVLFVLAPVGDFKEEHAAKVVEWVERGGTLVLAADQFNRLLDRLGVQVRRENVARAEAVLAQPVFAEPSPRLFAAQGAATLRLRETRWVPVLRSSPPSAAESGRVESALIAATATIGRGRALVLSDLHLLSNAGLASADNWRVVAEALAEVPGGRVAFDEYHHGLTERGALSARLVREPWGWAILYTAGLLLLYVGLRGRRFGRAISAQAQGARRSRGEYVVTLARLLRNGGHRAWLRSRYVAQVKRSLGARYRVPVDLPTADFVAALAEQRPQAAAIAGPLERLERRDRASEAAVVGLIREVDEMHARLVES